MRVPKIFIPDNPKDIINSPKKPKPKQISGLESLIPEKVSGVEKREEHPPFLGNCVLKGGVDTKSLKKTAVTWYDFNRLILLQYKTEVHLANNLKSVFENGLVLYKGNKIEFTKRFLFKDNISVYLEGDENFTKELITYYRKKGFKQLNYKLEAV